MQESPDSPTPRLNKKVGIPKKEKPTSNILFLDNYCSST